MAYEKHVGIYHTKEELTADLNKLKSPWVAYVGPNENGGFDVYYSNEMIIGNVPLNIAEILNQRVTNLEDKIVTLTEDEYQNLVENGKAIITPLEIKEVRENGMVYTQPNVNRIPVEVSYNPTVMYYTYDPEDLPKED